MSFSNGLEQNILNWLLNQTTFPAAPTAIYLSLHTSDPGETGGNEYSGNAYARQDITNSFPTNSGGGSCANDVAINFPTATSTWTAITHVGIQSASTAGTYYMGGALDVSKTVASGDALQFAIGALAISCD